MRKLVLFAIALSLLSACTSTENKEQDSNPVSNLGNSFDAKNVMANEDFRLQLNDKKELECALNGTIVADCENNDCDFKMSFFDGRDISVKLMNIDKFDVQSKLDENVIVHGKAKSIASPNGFDVILFEADGLVFE